MSRVRVMLAALGAILVGGGVWWTFQRQFAAPIASARTEAEALRTQIQNLETDITRGKKTRRELDDLALTMLGADAETVVHRLRVALSSIGEQAGLRGVVVDSRPRGVAESPAAAAFKSDRELRERIDFAVIEGTLRGRGTLAQVMSALATIESQAWPKRIKSLSIEPGKDHAELAVELDTLFFDDRPTKKNADAPMVAGIDAQRQALVDRLVAKNVFERPAVAVAQDRPAPEDRGSPVGDWVVTGWAAGSDGWELWLRCLKDQQTRVLPAGSTLLEATFVEVRDGFAVVQIGGQRYAVGLGQPLGTTERRIE